MHLEKSGTKATAFLFLYAGAGSAGQSFLTFLLLLIVVQLHDPALLHAAVAQLARESAL